MIVYWLRKEFRMEDNPALFKAVKRSEETKQPLLIVFCLDDNILKPENNIGFPRRYHLSKLLAAYKSKFPQFQIVYEQPEIFFEKLSAIASLEVWANSDVEPHPRQRDKKILEILKNNGSSITFLADQSSINLDIRSGQGNIYQVFTPFKNAVWQNFIALKPKPAPNFDDIKFVRLISKAFNIIDSEELGIDSETQNYTISDGAQFVSSNSDNLYTEIQAKLWKILDVPWVLKYSQSALNLDEILPRPKLDNWVLDEDEIKLQASQFIKAKIVNYQAGRDDLSLIDGSGTSRLSLALKWGLISPRSLVNLITSRYDLAENPGAVTYISELIWREFYRYILWHNPEVLDLEFQKRFTKTGPDGVSTSNISWVEGVQAESRFLAWIKGDTGYPLVDAAMQEIAQTGWMHNRTRMVTASILTKNLGVDWRWGQNYFRAMLVDLDEASNNGGWQWAASTGSDPKPIRIFNPYLQAEKYDPKNLYQQKWLPKNYQPQVIVPHEIARQEAMKRYGLSG